MAQDYRLHERYEETDTSKSNRKDNNALVANEEKALFQVYQTIYYILWILEVLLAFRFFFLLFGANANNAFVSFLYSITWIFVAPFYGIFDGVQTGDAVFDPATLVAMAVYAIAVYAIIKLVRIITAKKEPEPKEKI